MRRTYSPYSTRPTRYIVQVEVYIVNNIPVLLTILLYFQPCLIQIQMSNVILCNLMGRIKAGSLSKFFSLVLPFNFIRRAIQQTQEERCIYLVNKPFTFLQKLKCLWLRARRMFCSTLCSIGSSFSWLVPSPCFDLHPDFLLSTHSG